MVDINLGTVSADVPKDLFVCLRIGDVQKFAKASVTKGYRFPATAVADKRYGRLEIFQRIGSTSILIDPELSQGQHELTVPLQHNDVPNLTFRYHAAGPGGGSIGNPKESLNATQLEAQEYLVKHQVELQMFEAMQALLSERPSDPAAFIAQRLLSGAARTTKVAPLEGMKLTEEETRDMRKITAIQAKMASTLEKAAEEGRLVSALQGAPITEDAAARRQEEEADRLRAQARQTLAAATGDGSLAKALENIKRNPKSEESSPKVVPTEARVDIATVEALRETTKSSLTKAMDDGTLEMSLAKIQDERAQAELTDVIDLCRVALLEGAEDGTLDQALEIAKGDSLLENARTALLEASDTGLLDALLLEVTSPSPSPSGQARPPATVEQVDKAAAGSKEKLVEDPLTLRQRCRDVLVNASLDGRLENALSGVAQAAEPPLQDNISSLRTNCREVLVKASEDGSLAAALQNIAGQQLTSEEAKILKEENAELRRTVEELKVAVQRLQDERR
mmetsp:Transcript_5778/g.9936  ORF Transcript_5778/g.9936 Transcript_5778/m.9936 type:complete len:509 (-) Transcript_5778:95-1621(-)